MTPDPRERNARIYLTFGPGTTPGTMRIRLSRMAPRGSNPLAGLISRGQIAGEGDLDVELVSDPSADPALKGPKGDAGVKGDTGGKGDRGEAGATLLGTVTIAEAAGLSIVVAGARKVTVLTPAAWGVAPGGNYLLFPAGATPAGYVLGDAVATAANTLQVSLTGPLIAIGASFSIPCRLVRINT